MLKALLLDSGSTIKLKYTSDAPHLIYLTDTRGAGYYNCGYGCQWYDYDPGCLPCVPPPLMTTISAGYFHTIGSDNNKQVWDWGYNSYSQLGDNSSVQRLTPVSIQGARKTFCKISGGYYSTLGIDKTGQIWGWGYNNNGRLGDNSTTQRATPVSIKGNKKTFSQLCAGYFSTLGIDKNGTAWGWGYNNYGQLGDNTTTQRLTPVSILGANKTFCQITSAGYNSGAIDKNGQIWCWGANFYGGLGNNSTTAKCTPVSVQGSQKTFCQITSAFYNVFGVDKNGQLWCWGFNDYGQLGINSVTAKCTPVSVQGANKTFCKISSQYYSILGLDKNGQVWGWGDNGYGQLGNSSIAIQRTPVSILGNKKTFCQITIGRNFSVGVDKSGGVWGWGYNKFGQLGNNTTAYVGTPISIKGSKKTFCQITIGSQNASGIDKYGQVWGWGYNNKGQAGNNLSNQIIFTPISIQGVKKTFCQISVSYSYSTLGLDKNGQIWGWGYNNYGQLGINSLTAKCTPVSIQGAKKTFCQISSGKGHSAGIDKNGQIWGWGYNSFGQVGCYSNLNKSTPVSILGAKKTFCQITAQQNTTISVDKNGQTWSWGYNPYGGLGDGTTLARCTPVSILGAKKTFCKIANGDNYFTVGIDKNGQVWCWGYNSYGQLGDNNPGTNKCTPISIQGAKKTFCQITAGQQHSAGIDKNGQVWGWGYNRYGQLGVNSIAAQYTPVSILGAKKTFCQILSGGGTQTIGVDNKGQVWGWGYNRYGQLGINYNTTTPIRVCNF